MALTNEEAYLIKTMVDALKTTGVDTSAVDKALSIVLSFDELPPETKTEVLARATAIRK